MKFERLFLIAFFGNYLVNNVIAALASLVPPSQGATSMWTPQYITFVVLGLITLAILTWWYLSRMPRMGTTVQGLIFGVSGFVIAILTAFVTGISGVLLQTGSFQQVIAVLPNFGPYIMNMTTLVLLGIWVIPGVLVGWWLSRGGSRQKMSSPMPSSTM